jgi:hypothetical protein
MPRATRIGSGRARCNARANRLHTRPRTQRWRCENRYAQPDAQVSGQREKRVALPPGHNPGAPPRHAGAHAEDEGNGSGFFCQSIHVRADVVAEEPRGEALVSRQARARLAAVRRQ